MPNFATYPSLKDRIVLITGGAMGIGAALVEQFALQGARVAFLDVAQQPSEDLVQQLAPRCPHPPLFVACDLTDIAALRTAIAEITASCGPPTILVNNAGSDDRHAFADVTPEYFDQRIAVNLKHQFFAAQAVAPGMKSAGGGSIINMGSIAWMIPAASLSVYTTAKAAIVGMTLTIARDLAREAIRVNTIQPGIFNTPAMARATPQMLESLGSMVPFPQRLGNADEYASLALEMIRNGYFNGECVRLDGAIRMAPR